MFIVCVGRCGHAGAMLGKLGWAYLSGNGLGGFGFRASCSPGFRV